MAKLVFFFSDIILFYNRIHVYIIYIGQIVIDNNLLNMINNIIHMENLKYFYH